MRPVQADFARARMPTRSAWLALALILSAAVVVCIAAWQQHAQLALLRALAEQDRLDREAVQRPVGPPAPAYEASAREMLRERLSPWPLGLTALETVAIAGVTPAAIEIAAREGAISVELDFADQQRLLEYVEALNAGLGAGEPGWRWSLVSAQAQASSSGVARVKGAWRR